MCVDSSGSAPQLCKTISTSRAKQPQPFRAMLYMLGEDEDWSRHGFIQQHNRACDVNFMRGFQTEDGMFR
ncbi:hypothetical protein PDE_04308 [Penicillium oxalicum 114-2]|uniref:Uncharacterized protein n=1 Tax=Penicillium oxalicum (strain 114-2 / CGMCC 5302) TaxID=933388 RepID=S7ZGH9_PENO1|nr:hypothetical protein PDE_04308 [Penicillium oxalicum 114-2]